MRAHEVDRVVHDGPNLGYTQVNAFSSAQLGEGLHTTLLTVVVSYHEPYRRGEAHVQCGTPRKITVDESSRHRSCPGASNVRQRRSRPREMSAVVRESVMSSQDKAHIGGHQALGGLLLCCRRMLVVIGLGLTRNSHNDSINISAQTRAKVAADPRSLFTDVSVTVGSFIRCADTSGG